MKWIYHGLILINILVAIQNQQQLKLLKEKLKKMQKYNDEVLRTKIANIIKKH